MNIIDVIIILGILLAGVVGFKRGVFKELVLTVGMLLVFVLAFQFKNPIANWLSMRLPFFDFPAPFEGISVLNIIIYQSIAFIIVFSLIMVVFRIVLFFTKILEKILKFTIILGIPSKILGLIVGIIEGYIIAFFCLFILNQIVVSKDLINSSKLTNKILNSSPILTNVVEDANKAVTGVYDLLDDANHKDANTLNKETLDILLENNIVNVDYVIDLIDIGKLRIDGVDSVLNKYR